MREDHVVHREDDEEVELPGRTMWPNGEMLARAEPGWVRQNWEATEFVVRPEGDVEREERDAARAWLAHVEAGRIGSRS